MLIKCAFVGQKTLIPYNCVLNYVLSVHVTYFKKTRNVHLNITLRRFHVTIVAAEKQ
jgi:hypothetical protein